jgi:sulfate-transporting ATPase
MAEKILFHLEELHKFFGLREILKGITLSFFDGAKIGLIGANGSGKTTLLRIIGGIDTEFEGIAKPTRDISIGYLAQEPPLNDELDVAGNLEEAVAPVRNLVTRFNEITEKLGEVTDDAEMNKLYEEMGDLQEEIDHKDAWELDSHLEQAAHALCLPPLDADVTTLSGGERRRVALCKLLMSHPDMLLLDEPTNHLDAETINWLEQYLAEYQGTVILITHDRYFLDNVVGWMLEIDRGKARPYEGNYTQYLETKTKQLNVERRQDAAREKVLSRELDWIRKTPSARNKRSKARLTRYNELKQEKVEDQADSLELRIPPGPRLGDKVVVASGLKKGYGERVLFEDLNFEVPPGGILGVIGANGVGKTTLMKMIMGREESDAGSITIGSTVEMTYVDQSRTVLYDDKSVFDTITDGNELLPFGARTIDSRAYVARFNFKGEDQQRLLGECSGGMRNRVLLAKMLREPANLVIMDEPTNDLDLETLRVLEEAIQEYTGSMIVVTHDRYFLNRVATHILAFEGDGVVRFFHGDYEEYKDWLRKQGVDLDEKSGKFRKFHRT